MMMMTFGVNETARLFQVDRDIVKTWAYRFQDHLSSGANPSKGTPRCFTVDDLYVLTYVSQHWETHPDLENITYGLNYGHHRDELYREFVASVIPLFQEPPEELDETWRHGTLIYGIVAGTFDTFALANSFKHAGDILVDSALQTWDVSELVHPVLFNYRHATELYLKALLSPAKLDHDLKPLLDGLEEALRSEFKAEIPHWFKGMVLEFIEFDPASTAFRYGDSNRCDERWVDLPHVKLRMSWVANAFRKIMNARMRDR